MSLLEMQTMLARLYTNKQARENFWTNANDEILSPQEIQQLQQLSKQQVEIFASSLYNKRLNQLAKLLPLTKQILGEDFHPLFRLYSSGYIPQGHKKHLEDAITFVTWLRNYPHVPTFTKEVKELFSYEKTCLQIIDPECLFLCRWFNYDLEDLSLGKPSTQKTTIVIWWRWGRGKILNRLVWK